MRLDTDFWPDGDTQLTDYTETAILQTSQQIAIPAGTLAISCMLCGGGDGGDTVRGGAFGGLAVFTLPVLGAPLTLTIGEGGLAGQPGTPTIVRINGETWAAVGNGYPWRFNYYAPGLSRDIRRPTWSAIRLDGGNGAGAIVSDGASVPGLGSGGRQNVAGGTMASVTEWNRTGFAGGAATSQAGGGGGGMLAAGTNAVSTTSGTGGNGGGGGGGPRFGGGPGGKGFAIFRFRK